MMMNGKSLRAVCALLCCLMLGVLREGSRARRAGILRAARRSGIRERSHGGSAAVDEEFARVVEAAAPAAGRLRRSTGR